MQSKIGVVFALLSSLAFTSCSNRSEPNPDLLLPRNIISTRAQNSTHFIAIVKLQSPALLESAQKEKGRVVIDKQSLALIGKEQEAAITALKALSGEVQVLYRYKMVLNAVAVLAPNSIADKIKAIGLVAYSESAGNFERPITFESTNSMEAPPITVRNSAKFIGAEQLNASGITGRGIKVGVIDTGIDYTHAMMGGVGTAEAFSAVNPDLPNAAYPNAKVVGGIDLVGTTFDSASPEFLNHIPKPDLNPMDQGGHGSHVAGTVAGIGDNVKSYNGMAPDALLHAIKVFGAKGSTSDSVVIAALEYSADPNGDGQTDDQLDVVNMSLGSGYGNPHILYSEAIKNLVNGGTIVVASAGNSGHKDYIVGAPGTAEQAISVAASIDNGDHLWKFKAARLNLGAEKLLVEAIEGATTKKISEAGDVSGKLVFLGPAATDLTEEQKSAVNGNVALIDRGVVAFNDKIKRAAEAGAIGVIVANNKDAEAPFVMGTTDKFQIPAIMISLAAGKKVKEAMKAADVTVDFKTEDKIEKPELIDRLTDFTSKGPRSIDGFIKPEIAAPGQNVISAAMGGGNETVQMSGTSMAAPHMAGVMALVKQAHPDLSAEELKSLVMGTAKIIGEKGERYPVSQQGSGRVQAEQAAASLIVVAEPSVSLGEVAIESKKVFRRALTVKNLSKEEQKLDLTFEGNGFISMEESEQLTIEAGGSETVILLLTLDAADMGDDNIREMDGWVKLNQSGAEVYRVPVLAVAHRLSQAEASQLRVESTSELDSGGAAAELSLINKNSNAGRALLFNLIGKDERKPRAESFMTSDCDLQSAGYKIVSRTNDSGKKSDVLQVAVKLFKPMTTWNACDISLLIDTNGDGVAEQELLGASLKSIPGETADGMVTTLIDAAKAREIRKNFEKQVADAKNDPALLAKLKTAENYKSAYVDQGEMTAFNNSTVAILEIDVKSLALTEDGAVSFKLLVTHNEQSSVEFDDYLSSTVKADMRISLNKNDQSFVDLPESVTLDHQAPVTVGLTKGEGKEKLLVLFPENKFSLSNLHNDSQSQILTPVYSGK